MPHDGRPIEFIRYRGVGWDAVHEDLLAVCREAYPHYELGRSKSLVTLKMEAIYSSETSVLTRATRCKVPKDISNKRAKIISGCNTVQSGI
jgi:hypothetical protein